MTQRDMTSLQAFQKWFLSPAGPGLVRIPLHRPTFHKDGVTAITLYRRNGYQVEFCLISQGGHYVLDFPDGQYVTMAFLGGSLDCDITTVPNYPVAQGREYIPDAALERAEPDQHGPRLEQPHPFLSKPEEYRTICLSEGRKNRVICSSPKGDGLVLLFSFYEDDDCSCLKYLQPAPEKIP